MADLSEELFLVKQVTNRRDSFAPIKFTQQQHTQLLKVMSNNADEPGNNVTHHLTLFAPNFLEVGNGGGGSIDQSTVVNSFSTTINLIDEHYVEHSNIEKKSLQLDTALCTALLASTNSQIVSSCSGMTAVQSSTDVFAASPNCSSSIAGPSLSSASSSSPNNSSSSSSSIADPSLSSSSLSCAYSIASPSLSSALSSCSSIAVSSLSSALSSCSSIAVSSLNSTSSSCSSIVSTRAIAKSQDNTANTTTTSTSTDAAPSLISTQRLPSLGTDTTQFSFYIKSKWLYILLAILVIFVAVIAYILFINHNISQPSSSSYVAYSLAHALHSTACIPVSPQNISSGIVMDVSIAEIGKALRYHANAQRLEGICAQHLYGALPLCYCIVCVDCSNVKRKYDTKRQPVALPDVAYIDVFNLEVTSVSEENLAMSHETLLFCKDAQWVKRYENIIVRFLSSYGIANGNPIIYTGVFTPDTGAFSLQHFYEVHYGLPICIGDPTGILLDSLKEQIITGAKYKYSKDLRFQQYIAGTKTVSATPKSTHLLSTQQPR